MKLCNFAGLDPAIVNSGRRGLGNASALDRKVWERFQSNWDGEIATAAAELGMVVDEKQDLMEELIPLSIDTSHKREVEVRKKQQIFRRMVLSSYTGQCCMSGLSEPRLLVASHIIPWKKSTENRLNPKNGLCLSALHDKAFDIGLLTVYPDLSIAVSPQIGKLQQDKFLQEALVACQGRKISLPEKFHPSVEFLEWHNVNRFLR